VTTGPDGLAGPPAQLLRTARLDLEPLRVDSAEEAAAAFDDVALHAFTGGRPASVEELRARYARQVAGHSPDGSEGWLNWLLRRRADGRLVGTVQATLHREPVGLVAELAWVVATAAQGQGLAREAATAMAGWLRAQGAHRFMASVHPDHRASIGVARALGLQPTDTVVDGEVCWSG